MSTAGCRGQYWAAKVARAVGVTRDWSPFEGKARLIALRWIDDLGGDAATKERRAFYCWRCAEFDWGRTFPLEGNSIYAFLRIGDYRFIVGKLPPISRAVPDPWIEASGN